MYFGFGSFSRWYQHMAFCKANNEDVENNVFLCCLKNVYLISWLPFKLLAAASSAVSKHSLLH